MADLTSSMTPDHGQTAETSIEAWLAKLSSTNSGTRREARFALVGIGHLAVAPLMQLCQHADRQLQWETCKTLSQIGDAEAVPVFLKALEDERLEIRWIGAEGLIAVGRKNPEDLKPLLHALLHSPNSTWLREGAHHVFHDLAIYYDRPVFKPLLAALSDLDWTIKTPPAIHQVLDDLAD